MSKTKDEVRAYARGYAAGGARRWPDHRPPAPPDPLARQLFGALHALRDAVSSEIATFDDNDEIVLRLTPPIEVANRAMRDLTRWLRSDDTEADLLKACSDWIAHLDSGPDDEEDFDGEQRLIDAMRVAIAKATSAAPGGGA